ncbi:MAG: CBS domain-containing protein [Saprospiraceae bacterium]|uniref:CBS domain-containing protein n=1 Tax=Candidatus Opimibacter skivensis TaxID=2982028 RepID=A0A9D7XSA2_9BACT|nr:CBS domain-containing protein [Candidatus Opimibacter skivensis]
MDFTAPVSKFMSKKLLTVSPTDNMMAVKEIFNNHRIHHIPVVKYKTIVGIVSKADYLYFLRKVKTGEHAPLVEDSGLEKYQVEDIMTTGLATMESTERINVALDVLSENLFHAIPIVDNGELVGIFTTQDVLKILMEEDLVRMKSN